VPKTGCKEEMAKPVENNEFKHIWHDFIPPEEQSTIGERKSPISDEASAAPG
jgi:hypothetical protein